VNFESAKTRDFASKLHRKLAVFNRTELTSLVFTFLPQQAHDRPKNIFDLTHDYLNIFRLVTASMDSTVRVWQMLTSECIHVLQGHVGAVRCVDFDGYKSILT
jgi:WD40 repeat protein